MGRSLGTWDGNFEVVEAMEAGRITYRQWCLHEWLVGLTRRGKVSTLGNLDDLMREISTSTDILDDLNALAAAGFLGNDLKACISDYSA